MCGHSDIRRLNICYFITLLFCYTALVKNGAAKSETIIYRDTWLGDTTFDDSQSNKLVRPVKYVVIDDLTASGFDSCYRKSQCVALIQKIYTKHKLIWDDIGYNFLIGGDGTVYEGRGWFKQGFAIDHFNHLCLSVAYLGNFTDTKSVKSKLLDTIQFLGDKGREHHILKDDFKILTRPQIIKKSVKGNKRLINTMITDSKFYTFISNSTYWTNITVETSIVEKIKGDESRKEAT
ncbi:peptidoglycan-recognition protein SC2-like [Chelonus insularis]|uniref:peptidoglycan-recognition protein SC2-like n=1 Tax=Chelonus insularis TaxID=460826 RepID=UPI001588E5A1|nr:peptidoglycan-recognition protein SC2-like [Chelonus insularis]